MLNNNGLCPSSTNSTGGKFQLVSNFTKLHVLTPATHSCVLLVQRLLLCRYASVKCNHRKKKEFLVSANK